MASSNNNSSGGIGFCGVLTIVFVTLKLLGHIDWSWWWVLSPIWIGAAASISLILIFLLIMFIADYAKQNRRRK